MIQGLYCNADGSFFMMTGVIHAGGREWVGMCRWNRIPWSVYEEPEPFSSHCGYMDPASGGRIWFCHRMGDRGQRGGWGGDSRAISNFHAHRVAIAYPLPDGYFNALARQAHKYFQASPYANAIGDSDTPWGAIPRMDRDGLSHTKRYPNGFVDADLDGYTDGFFHSNMDSE